MNSILKSVFFCICLWGIISCGSGTENQTIHENGVGRVTFSQEIPDMGKGYTTEEDEIFYDDDQGYPYFVIKNKAGERVVLVFPEQSIEVLSSEFKTSNGIYPGMNLHEAAEITGKDNLSIWLGWPDNFFTLEDQTSGLMWTVNGDQLIGGWDAFQEYSVTGKPEITLEHFEPDASIAGIIVINK